ncbi:MAG: hypothetical protein ACI9R3_001425 [Verrucomicrobiales bacterium]|jgi:hypothetical protein
MIGGVNTDKEERKRQRKAKSQRSKKGAGKATASRNVTPIEIEAKARQVESMGDYERARTGHSAEQDTSSFWMVGNIVLHRSEEPDHIRSGNSHQILPPRGCTERASCSSWLFHTPGTK